ncbi:MAG: TRAP transporter substrate-binding protein [Ignavibacteriae bacterium]|nr:TRAP transporter substrate-binding protein [Ignavibacteriota bacterium]MCB0724722.1 TRAP transporter substrate-binding protein [Ignavibacteriota bacterium]MCB9242265.1 TRAP transporter substrate-binding protein [Ignavibacteriales bacterium]
MDKFNRRKFIKSASLASLGSASLLAAACSKKEGDHNVSVNINTNETYEWKMVTTWPPNFPIFTDRLNEFAKAVEKMSSGRMKIQVYGGGELVPPFESFEAVSQGTAEMGHGAAYYWAGKSPVMQFFTSVPFGMNAQQTNAWLYYGGGLDLWREEYAKYNLTTFPGGNTGGQMGGWFNKEINTIADFNGLKIRMPGLGGKVVTKAGATSILSPGGEIYTNLERGVIDATEWIGPNHDYVMGFHKIAKYYYYPGWHEPSACCDLFINKATFDKLPAELQDMISEGAAALNVEMLSDFETKNSEYLIKIKQESGVELKEFPQEVLDKLQELTAEVINEITNSNADCKRVYDSYKQFYDNIAQWSSLVDRNYLAGQNTAPEKKEEEKKPA